MYVYIYTCIHLYISACIRIYIYTNLHFYIHTHVYIYLYIYTYARQCVQESALQERSSFKTVVSGCLSPTPSPDSLLFRASKALRSCGEQPALFQRYTIKVGNPAAHPSKLAPDLGKLPIFAALRPLCGKVWIEACGDIKKRLI